MAEKKLNIFELKQARVSWKSVLDECLDQESRQIFLKRKQAVDMYIDGQRLNDIFTETGISPTSVARLVKKCTQKSLNTNEELGYVALLPYKRSKQYSRTSQTIGNTVGLSGAFKKLLSDYPSLETFLYNNYFGNKNDILEKNITPTILHRKFLEECARLGIEKYEYPFNTTRKGIMALRNYLDNLVQENAKSAICRESKEATQRFNSTGYGRKYSLIPISPFSVVQLDGHKIDMLYTIETENKSGELIRNTATRAWLIAIVDVATRVILGYSISPHENYNQTDVLLAIQNAITPKKQLTFTISGFSYPPNGGFHSLAIPTTEWSLFDCIMLDNAKAHLAKDVVNKLVEKLKCSVNFGSVATPETRGIVERMFKTLEENGYHRTPSTTGSHSKDLKRKNAEEDAIKYQISFNDLEQLTEYLISIYNNTPHSALDNETPLQRMERRINELGMYPCIATSTEREIVNNISNLLITRTIRGGYSNGKKPYISYLGVEYRNNIVPLSMSLVGQPIIIEVNPQDISFVKAYLTDGSELGILSATGEWGRKPHSTKTRLQAMKFAKDNKREHVGFYAPISEFEQDLRERAKKSRRASTKAAIVQKEQSQENPSNYKTNETVSHPTSSKEASLSTPNKSTESYPPEIEKLLLSMSIEEAFEKGLL